MKYNHSVIVLHKTADFLEKTGWCQYAFVERVNGKRSFCIMGALYEVCPDSAQRLTAQILLEDYVKEPIVRWNDKKTQTLKKVLKTLRSIAP